MIKFSTRHNLLYIILSIITYNIRRIIKMLFGPIFALGNSIFFTALMFIGEMSTGFIISQYQKVTFSKNKKKFFSNSLRIKQRNFNKKKDSDLIIYFLIFMISFFDFFEFSISVFYISKFPDISSSLESRLTGIVIIFSSMIHFFVLKLKILRHQLFSLIIIGVCLVVIITSEIIIKKEEVFLSGGNLTLVIL